MGSVNCVASARKSSGTWGNDGFVKYVVVVVEKRERSKTAANAALSFTFSVERTDEEKVGGHERQIGTNWTR